MYKFRIKIFLGVIALVFLGLLGRLLQLQVVSGDQYLRNLGGLLNRGQRLESNRGRILDRNGKILAMDEPCYDLCLSYRFLTADPRWTRKQVASIARAEGLSPEQAQAVFERRSANTWEVARRLAEQGGQDLDEVADSVIERVRAVRQDVIDRRARLGLTPVESVAEEDQVHPVATGLESPAGLDLNDTVGILVRPSFRRLYPYKDAACHIIGRTAQVSLDDMRSRNLDESADAMEAIRVNYRPGDQIGQGGVERMCEGLLRGRHGYRLERRRGGETVEQTPPEGGQDIHLTLDIKLQEELMKVWKAQTTPGSTGAIVILSVPTGDVLAMVSMPTYDINTYARDYKELVKDEVYLPMLNRAVAGRYPPGSTAKPVTALAAMKTGLFALDTQIHCKGYLFSPDSYRCWIWKHHVGHGPLDVVGAIRYSCNIYFYQAGMRLGLGRLAEWFKRFGYGGKPGTGLPEEIAGYVPTDSRYDGEARLMAIGQGQVTVSPLQVANAMAAIARGGTLLSPVLALEGSPARVREDLGLSRSHIEAIHRGMYEVVNSRDGTGYSVFHEREAQPLEVAVCGKSGTADAAPQRVDSNDDRRITGADTIVREGNMAWFAGFAPRGNPTIAFAVVVDYVDGGGAKNAGPVAREAIRVCRDLGYIH